MAEDFRVSGQQYDDAVSEVFDRLFSGEWDRELDARLMDLMNEPPLFVNADPRQIPVLMKVAYEVLRVLGTEPSEEVDITPLLIMFQQGYSYSLKYGPLTPPEGE